MARSVTINRCSRNKLSLPIIWSRGEAQGLAGMEGEGAGGGRGSKEIGGGYD